MIAVIAGGVALAISPFLPWVKVVLLGNLNLFQLFEAADSSTATPWLTLLAGAGAAFAVYRTQRLATIRRVGLIVGILGGILALYALFGLREEVSGANGLATVGIGPYLASAGCIAMVAGALRAKRPRVGADARAGTA